MVADIFEIARNGTPQDLIICVAKEMVPKWRNYFQKAAIVKAARQNKRKADEEVLASVEVPWLYKKSKVEKEAAEEIPTMDSPYLDGKDNAHNFLPEKSPSSSEAPSVTCSGAKIDSPREEGSPTVAQTASKTQTSPNDTDDSTDPADSEKMNSRICPLLILCKSEDSQLEAFCRKKLINLLNMRDKNNRNALHLAAFSGNIEMMRLLSRPDPQIGPIIPIYSPAQDNMQPIHFAASAGHTAAVKECIKLGARVNAATTKGSKTPLYFAQQKQHEETIAYLTKRGGRLGLDQKMEKDKEFQEFLASTKKVTEPVEGEE